MRVSKRIEEVIEKVLHLEGNSDHLCLVCMPNACGVCGLSISIGTFDLA